MSRTLRGVGVSPGSAIGPVHTILDVRTEPGAVGPPGEERAALDAAVLESAGQLEELATRLRSEGHEAEAGIIDAQVLMARDPSFLELVWQGIDSGLGAVRAVQEAAAHFQAMFQGLDDPYLAARAADVEDIADRLVRRLLHATETPLDVPSIVVARDLSPSQTAQLDRSLVLGFATDAGSATSHTAILAGALGIPAVVALRTVTAEVRDGEEIALDGATGIVLIRPSDAEKAALAVNMTREHAERKHLQAIRHEPAETVDGHRLTLAANIGSPDELPAVLAVAAEGIGLFRTEFLFAGRERMPSEEEQVEAYSTVLEAMAPHTVVVRTLDVGGDKPLPYLPQPQEMNPFLGERGIRYTSAHPEVFRRQIRALLRASVCGKLAIIFPMVSDLAQIQQATQVLDEVKSEVGGEAEVGIMIEIPAAALTAGQLARHITFFSVGTNDLVQYGLAVDRTNPQVAPLYRPLHPGILRLLQMTVEGAHAQGRWVGVCGEMAGDLPAIPILVGLGFDELSMTPGRIPAAKARIRSLDATVCRELAARSLLCESADDVERLVRESLPG